MFKQLEHGVDEYSAVPVLVGPKCHYNGINGYGNLNSEIMFIGISPARDETTRSKRPLTGQSGLLLNACLEALNMKRSDVYTTNLLCHWVNDLDTVTPEFIKGCLPRLKEEIKQVKPKLIILLGTLVTEYITKRSFNKVRGAVQWNEEFNAYVLGTYHPAAILRSLGDYGSSKDDKASKMTPDFLRDLKKIPFVLTWQPKAPQASIAYKVVTEIEEAQFTLDMLASYSKDKLIGLDVETTYGKDDEEVEVFKDDVLCVGIGTSDFCWVFTPTALYTKDGKPALEWPDLNWVMHNSIFDSQVMRRKLGVWLTIKEDTMLQSYSLDERSGVHKLKTLSREYLSAGFYEDDRFYGKLKLEEIPKEMLYEYNATDVIYTVRLCEIFTQWQIEDNVRDFYKQILIPAVNMYKECQYYGVNIDMMMHLKLTWEWGLKINEDEDKIQDIAQDNGWEGTLNISSSDQLATFLFKILGLPCKKYTKGGKPSVDKEVIESLREQHEFIPLLEGLRRRYKMWGSYIISLPEKLKVDGRAHPIVKLHGTVNGRPAYTDLAVQTFVAPSAPHEYNNMRQLIIAPPYEGYNGTDDYEPPKDDEYVIVEVDYGKAELWTAYSYSQDKQMLLDLLSGDYHTNVAMDILEKTIEYITKDDRTTAKRTTFGILYDIERNTLGKLTHSNPFLAQERINRWYARNQGYKDWHDLVQKQMLTTGELQSKTGRKRRIPILGNAHRAVKQAVNFPIQSTSNDVVLVSAVAMHPRLKQIGSHILFTVHDSIVTVALRSRLQEHCLIMHEEMIKTRFEGVVPIPVEIKVGKNWGLVEGIHDCSESPEHKINRANEYGFVIGGNCLWPYYENTLNVDMTTCQFKN